MFSLHPQFWLWFAVLMSLAVLGTVSVALFTGTLSAWSGDAVRRRVRQLRRRDRDER